MTWRLYLGSERVGEGVKGLYPKVDNDVVILLGLK